MEFFRHNCGGEKMEKLKKIKKFVKEVVHLVTGFCKPLKIADEILDIPKSVKRIGFRTGIITLVATGVGLVSSFMLQATNMAIETKYILLGIVLYMFYKAQQIITATLNMVCEPRKEELELCVEQEITLLGSKIMSKTSNKILRYEPQKRVYEIMTNEKVVNTLKSYMLNAWNEKIKHLFEIVRVLGVVLMLVVAIVMNNKVPNGYFTLMLIIFSVLTFCVTAYINSKQSEYWCEEKEATERSDVFLHDLIRVNPIVSHDVDMRIKKIREALYNVRKSKTKLNQKVNSVWVALMGIELVARYGIIITYLATIKWSTLTLAGIAEITAILAVVETALLQIRSIAHILANRQEAIQRLDKIKDDISLILKVYHRETKNASTKKVEQILVNPFSISYIEESENDRPFELKLENQLTINKGEVVLLYGASGSGKSTFMKMLTGKVQLKDSEEIPTTARFLLYDETMGFGSMSMFDELFCCQEKPDLPRMQGILKNLNLWDEIKSNCVDVWTWLGEKRYNKSLSNGQKQRIVLAKMLYWMDDNIDVLALDECTSGLDDKSDVGIANAERVLEYIVRYANQDKKRIVIISTHQNIDGFKENIANEARIRSLKFVKEGECNIIREI